MPIWKCLLVAIASNLKLIALGSLISSDVISGLDQLQGQSASYKIKQPGTRPLSVGLIQFQATCLWQVELFEPTGDGQGGLACCNSWGRKELDTTEQLIWSDLIWQRFLKSGFFSGEVVLIPEWSKEAISGCHHLICCQRMRHLVPAEGPAGSLSVRTSGEAAISRGYLEYK